MGTDLATLGDGAWVPFTTRDGATTLDLWCREGTNDRSVAQAVVAEDEYDTQQWAPTPGAELLDIGAHIGAWGTMMLRRWDDIRVTLVEPLAANLAAIEANLGRAGVRDRARVVPGALAGSLGTVDVWSGWQPLPGAGADDREAATLHRHIGNQRMPASLVPTVREAVPGVTIGTLLELAGGEVELAKCDCEGGEAGLIGHDLAGIWRIVGQYHIDRGPLWEWMTRTHRVGMDGEPTFGSFRAERREPRETRPLCRSGESMPLLAVPPVAIVGCGSPWHCR